MDNQSPETANPLKGDSGLVFDRAILDDNQVIVICRNVVHDNEERNRVATAVMSKFNNEPPFNPAELKNLGQDWRSNQATGFMANLVSRVTPQFRRVVESSETLVFNKLEDTDIPGMVDPAIVAEHTTVFQEEVTKTIRAWSQFDDFTDRFCQETCLFGYGSGVWFDESAWTPYLGRMDEVLFPNECNATPETIPLFVVEQKLLLHELAAFLRQQDVSKDAGWNIPNLRAAIKSSTPIDRESSAGPENSRRVQDADRESTVGHSFTTNIRHVKVYPLFITEPASGRVSHYIVHADPTNPDGTNSPTTEGEPTGLLFKRLDRFEKMSDCLRVTTLEVGNGKLHGSKGLGRVIYNTHVAVERARNLFVDAVYLSALLLLEGDESNSQALELTIQHPIAVLPRGWKPVEKGGFTANFEAFQALDAHFQRVGEQQSGSFLPAMQLDPATGERTASEINYTASIEQYLKESKLRRFFNQFTGLTDTMAKRICSAENVIKAQQMIQREKDSKTPSSRFTRAALQFARDVWVNVAGEGARIATLEKKLKAMGLAEKDLPSDAVECVYRMMKRGLGPEEIYTMSRKTSKRDYSGALDNDPQAIEMLVTRWLGNPMVDQTHLARLDISSKVGPVEARRLIVKDPASNPSTIANVSQQIIELQSLLSGDALPVRPFDDDVAHLDVMSRRLAPLVQQALPPGGGESLMPLVQHFAEHVQQAASKGVQKQVLAPYLQLLQAAQAAVQSAGPMPEAPGLPQGVRPANPGALTREGFVPGGQGTPLRSTDVAPAGQDAVNKPLSRLAGQPANLPTL